MAKQKNPRKDANQIAKMVADIATGQKPKPVPKKAVKDKKKATK